MVRAVLAEDPISRVDAIRQEAVVRVVTTSVAASGPNEGGDQLDIDVAVGVRTDTLEFFVRRVRDGRVKWSICSARLFLRRTELSWAVVKRWNPPGSSWTTVSRLADSLQRTSR
jgi:hypothetical protein